MGTAVMTGDLGHQDVSHRPDDQLTVVRPPPPSPSEDVVEILIEVEATRLRDIRLTFRWSLGALIGAIATVALAMVVAAFAEGRLVTGSLLTLSIPTATAVLALLPPIIAIVSWWLRARRDAERGHKQAQQHTDLLGIAWSNTQDKARELEQR